jgi:hypothetical protein
MSYSRMINMKEFQKTHWSVGWHQGLLVMCPQKGKNQLC